MLDVNQTWTAEAVATALGISPRRVRQLAAQQQWQSRTQQVLGGHRTSYVLASMPISVRQSLLGRAALPAECAGISAGLMEIARPADRALRQVEDFMTLPMETRQRAEARAAVVQCCEAYCQVTGKGTKAGIAGFVKLANQGAVELLCPETMARATSRKKAVLSAPTVHRWMLALRAKGICGLTDKYKAGRAKTVSKAQGDMLLACALSPNAPLEAEAIRSARQLMAARGIEDGLSDDTYRRWLKDWRATHMDLWVFMRQGKKQWNDKVALYIERDPTLINVGDLIVADGHVLDFEILSPVTGKPKRMHLILWYDFRSNMPLGWEIDESENTACIASALRRAILRLGRIPSIAYMDNGKSFRAKFFQSCPDLSTCGFAGIFNAMGIHTIYAWAYHGQSKTIERFFKSFGELERLLPSYTGSSVDTKPARMRRNEELHRRLHAKVLPDGAITLEDAHRAVAAWFEAYSNRPQRGHLNGATPAEVFNAGIGAGIDPDALHELMLAEAGRVIRNGTVTFKSRRYYAPCLYGRHHGCTVRYDIQDPTYIVVYDEKGNRIGKAEELPKLHPAATILGDDQDRALLSAMIAEKRRQLKHTAAPLRQLVEDMVIPEARARMALLGIEGPGAADRQSGDKPPALPELTDEQAAKILEQVEAGQVEDDASAFFGRLASMPEPERYEALLEAEGQGWLIPERWQKFMSYFEDSEAYQRQADYWQDRRAVLAIMQQHRGGAHG